MRHSILYALLSVCGDRISGINLNIVYTKRNIDYRRWPFVLQKPIVITNRSLKSRKYANTIYINISMKRKKTHREKLVARARRLLYRLPTTVFRVYTIKNRRNRFFFFFDLI